VAMIPDPVEAFEAGLDGQLSKLRQAISLLDQSFKRKPAPSPAEPSFADLVSDSARQKAG
jgi:hypothetical protein